MTCGEQCVQSGGMEPNSPLSLLYASTQLSSEVASFIVWWPFDGFLLLASGRPSPSRNGLHRVINLMVLDIILPFPEVPTLVVGVVGGDGWKWGNVVLTGSPLSQWSPSWSSCRTPGLTPMGRSYWRMLFPPPQLYSEPYEISPASFSFPLFR